MIRRPPRSTRTDTLFPYTTLFRSGRTMLRTAGVPLDALPWRKPSLAAADAGHRRLSARPPDQLRAGDGRTRSIGAVRSQLSRPRLDQGLSGPDEPRHVSSEERRVGNECVSPVRSRWWPLL